MKFQDAIVYVGLFQALFASLLLVTKRRASISDFILAACLLSIAVRFFSKIAQAMPMMEWTVVFVAIIPLTFGPFLFLYAKYLTSGSSAFDWMDGLHFAPFLLFLVINAFLPLQEFKFEPIHFFQPDDLLWIRVLFGLVFFSSILLYTIFTFQKLVHFRKKIRNENLQTTHNIKLHWLSFVLMLFVMLFASYLVIGLVNALSFSEVVNLDHVSNLGLISLVYATSYFGVRQPSILEDIYINRFNVTPAIFESERSVIDREELELRSMKLQKFMEVEKPYLMPNLTLAELSRSVGLTKSELTFLLNDHLGMNFFTYINNYRLKLFIEKLKDPKNKHLTILSIAFDSGFNSKSTFNGLFKQMTGLTPSDYRKQNQ